MSGDVRRRTILAGGLRLIACGALSHAVTAHGDAAAAPPKAGDLLARSDGPRPLTANDVRPGEPILAWPMDPSDGLVRSASRLNAVVLVRVDAGQLIGPTRDRAADGVVAYSAICTHNGCEVTDWVPDTGVLSCPCHDSEFDPKDEAKVVDGPAPRSLAALPLKIADGKLVVTGSFTAPVGV